MIQLAYQPAYDGYHSIFRIVRLLLILGERSAQIDSCQICSFYLLFPHYLVSTRLPQKISRLKAKLSPSSQQKPYQMMPEKRIVFQHMKPFSEAAIQTLASKDFLDKEQFFLGFISRTGRSLPDGVLRLASEANDEDQALATILDGLFSIPLEGFGGLKERSGLMEYRYDAVRADTAGPQTRNTFA